MRRTNRRDPRLELGVLLLFSEMFNFGFGKVPPVTLLSILGQALLYMGIIQVPWDKWDVCISADKVLNARDYRRLVISAFEHGDDMHLYYNMISFLLKGSSLERRYHSMNFLILLVIITLMTSGIYVGLAVGCARFMVDYSYMKSCAIGFSGVLFALKVITMKESEPRMVNVAGIMVPSRYAAWVELIAIHLLVPNASFMGHLAGILAGFIYTSTFIGTIIDELIRLITG
ncbi:rhomboid-related protein 4-like isoform X2 [Lycorma delicatula]